MKRQLIFGAAVLLGATSTQAETISWWLPNWDEKPARAIVADYETANPGEKVDIVITTWDTMAQKILVGLESRNAPDVITELESRTLRYARRNLLADLTSVVTKLGKDDFVPTALATGEYEGHYYSVPFRHDGAGLFYNKDMFAAAGLDPEHPPQTWGTFPFVMLMVSAGLQSIDSSLLDAARVDGAGWFSETVHIILPALRNVMFIIALILVVWALNSLIPIWILTQGGPAGATSTMPIYIYSAFRDFNLSAASTASCLLLAVSLLFAGIYVLRVTKEA